MKQIVICVALLLLLLSQPVCAQEENRVIGISANIQQGQWGVSFPLWFSNSFCIVPSVSIVSAENVGRDWSVHFNPRYYFNDEGVSPFVGARIGFIGNTPFPAAVINKEATTDVATGLGFGIDYFFEPKFSIGVEAQGNFTKSHENSHRFGNPGGWNFNTAAVVSISIYY